MDAYDPFTSDSILTGSRPVDTEPVAVDVRSALERAIADFLRGIDPNTGYLAD